MTENVVSALARDYICEVMLKAEEVGYEVLLQIHDEVILHVPEEKSEEALQFLLDMLRTAPSWLPGLPLEAEGWIAKCLGRQA